MHSNKPKKKKTDENKKTKNEMKSITSCYINECHNMIHKNLDCKMAVRFLQLNAYNKKNSK